VPKITELLLHRDFETDFSSQRQLRKGQASRNCPFCWLALFTKTLAQNPDLASLFICEGTALVHIEAREYGQYSKTVDEHIVVHRFSLSASSVTEGQPTPTKGERWIQRLWKPSRTASSASLSGEISFLWGRRVGEQANLSLL
jgi:hypothetical protein